MATLQEKLLRLERNDFDGAIEIVRAGHKFGTDDVEILYMTFDEPTELRDALREAGVKIKRKPSRP